MTTKTKIIHKLDLWNDMSYCEWKEMTFIATYKNVEDNRLDNYYSETLYRARDGSFTLQCFGNANSKHAKVKGEERCRNLYYIEIDPIQWLIDHNHQRLAGILFPNMQKQIEKNLHDLVLQCEMLKDDFYQYQFKSRQTKSELMAICKKANAIVGHEGLFVVEDEVEGIVMFPGYENYDEDNWDFYDKIKGNTYSGDYEILFNLGDGCVVVPKECTHSAESVVLYFEREKEEEDFEKAT